MGRDAEVLRRELGAWLKEQVMATRTRGVVVGLSGGIDSAVVVALAAEALGPDRCLGLILPIESQELDIRLGAESAAACGVEALTIDLSADFQGLLARLARHRERAARLGGGTADVADAASGQSPGASAAADAMARANLKPRMRMMALYYYANLLGYLVLGTGNRAERIVGYFTKFGDGAADALPLADLTKAEVRALAVALGVPAEIVERPPSAGLWPGQTDEEELGISYEQLDRFLEEGTSGEPKVDAEIRRRSELSRHKLEPPPAAAPGSGE
jgi:NAD+ synthase